MERALKLRRRPGSRVPPQQRLQAFPREPARWRRRQVGEASIKRFHDKGDFPVVCQRLLDHFFPLHKGQMFATSSRNALRSMRKL
jgi:hypothetical protein